MTKPFPQKILRVSDNKKFELTDEMILSDKNGDTIIKLPNGTELEWYEWVPIPQLCNMCSKAYEPGDQDLCDDCLNCRTQMMEDQNGERI